MAFQYVSPPQNRSGLLLGAGIASAGRDVGEGLRDAILQHKQNVQDQASADTAFPMMVNLYQKAGLRLDPDVVSKFGSSGVSAKKGILGGMASSLAMYQKTQQEQAQSDELNARAADRQSEANANQVAGNFLKDYLTAPTSAGVPGTNTSDDDSQAGASPAPGGVSDAAKAIMTQAGIPEDDHDQTYSAFKYAASRMPANADANRVMPKVLDSLSKINALKYGQNGEASPAFTEDPVSGNRFVTYGKNLQSSGMNPDKVATDMGTAVPVGQMIQTAISRVIMSRRRAARRAGSHSSR